jgi:hypothetical protein
MGGEKIKNKTRKADDDDRAEITFIHMYVHKHNSSFMGFGREHCKLSIYE